MRAYQAWLHGGRGEALHVSNVVRFWQPACSPAALYMVDLLHAYWLELFLTQMPHAAACDPGWRLLKKQGKQQEIQPS